MKTATSAFILAALALCGCLWLLLAEIPLPEWLTHATVGLLTIRLEEIGPTRAHVARQMLDEHGLAVATPRRRHAKVAIRDLAQGTRSPTWPTWPSRRGRAPPAGRCRGR